MILGLAAKRARSLTNERGEAEAGQRRVDINRKDVQGGFGPKRSSWHATAKPLALAFLVLALGCTEINAQPEKLTAEEIEQLNQWSNALPGSRNWKFDEAVRRAHILGYRDRFDLWTRLDYERFREAYRQVVWDDAWGFIGEGLFGTESDGDGGGDGPD